MRLLPLVPGRPPWADCPIIWDVENPMGVAAGETRSALERANRELFRREKVYFNWVSALTSARRRHRLGQPGGCDAQGMDRPCPRIDAVARRRGRAGAGCAATTG